MLVAMMLPPTHW